MIYDSNYQNEQAVSVLFQKHLDSVAQIVGRSLGHDKLVEVGCGKGFFLEMLRKQDFDIAGFDPTYEGNNPLILRQYFQPDSGIQAKGLILRHVLEHIQNPLVFLEQLKKANGGSGKIYIEVPCFDWICENKAWFDIFYEHVNYFRLSDFHRMFGTVIESGRFFGEQYLYVVAELATLQTPQINVNDRATIPSDFTQSIDMQKGTQATAIWGGASKGVIYSLLKERAGHSIDIVIDINPAKQGKYLPATGLLVQVPSQALATLPKGSTIFVMNSNYLDEIRKISNNAFHYIEIDHA